MQHPGTRVVGHKIDVGTRHGRQQKRVLACPAAPRRTDLERMTVQMNGVTHHRHVRQSQPHLLTLGHHQWACAVVGDPVEHPDIRRHRPGQNQVIGHVGRGGGQFYRRVRLQCLDAYRIGRETLGTPLTGGGSVDGSQQRQRLAHLAQRLRHHGEDSLSTSTRTS